MAVYKSINGTSKKSFKIGLKGVELSTLDTGVTDADGKSIKQLLVDQKAVVTENSIFIQRDVVTRFQLNDDQTECTFEYKYYTETDGWKSKTVTVRTIDHPLVQSGAIQGPGNGKTSAGSIAVFADSTGSKLESPGFKILSSFLNSTDDSKEVPTVKVVKEMIYEATEPLELRRSGSTAKII